MYAGTIHASNPEHLLVFKASRGLETGHDVSGPMEGLKINFTGRVHSTHIHTDIATL